MTAEHWPDSCAAEIASFDWPAVGLGPPQDWPDTLRTLLGMMFSSAAPKLLLWGEEHRAFFNEAYVKVMPGQLAAASLGRPLAELLPAVWEHAAGFVRSAMNGASLLSSELVLRPAGLGSSDPGYFTLCYTPARDGTDRVQGVLIDVYDATASRLLEQALRSKNSQLSQLFAEAPVVIALATGPELKLEFVNRASENIFGSRRNGNVSGAEQMPKIGDQRLLALLREVYLSGRAQVFPDFRLFQREPRTGAEQSWFLDIVCQPVRDEADAVYGVLFTAYDVTHRNLVQDEASRLQHRQLHESRLDAMGTMAMTLAHELNQPLSVVGNYIGAARRLLSETTPDIAELLRLAQEEIRRAGDVVRRARSLVRLGTAERTCVSIQRACEKAMSLLEASGVHELEVSMSLAMDATHVLADEVQLEQVLLNLLLNAAEASRNSDVKKVHIETRRSGPARVRVTLRDYGPGFDEVALGHLFDRVGMSSGAGLGVGLALTRTLLEANGGSIQAGNATDGGAILVLEFDAPIG